MASGKVARRTVVADVAALLDSPEIAALVAETDAAGSPRGRKGYGARALVGACLVRSLFGLPTWTLTAAREFGRLKNDYGLGPLRVRGAERVSLHADLTIMARLALALNRSQEVALVA